LVKAEALALRFLKAGLGASFFRVCEIVRPDSAKDALKPPHRTGEVNCQRFAFLFLPSGGGCGTFSIMGQDGNEFVGEVMAYLKDQPPTVGAVLTAMQDERGRTYQLTIQLTDGTTRTGSVDDFRDATDTEHEKYVRDSPPQ
jgi:hypothetical protein